MTCLITKSVSGLCPQCGDDMEPAHVVESPVLSLSCARCCPACGIQLSVDWASEPAATTSGKQERLF